MYCPEHVVASWNPDRKGSLQRITFSWCILNNIPTCIYVSKLGNRTPTPHHSPLLLLPNVPFEIPVSCSSPASIVLWSRIHYFISLFLPCCLHNCKVSELHPGSSIFGFRHVQFPDRLRFEPFAQLNIATQTITNSIRFPSYRFSQQNVPRIHKIWRNITGEIEYDL
jgi:hypothetical protein